MSADTLRRLSALHLAPEAMQEVLSIIASCIEPLEERRRRERVRQRSHRDNVTGQSQEMSRDKACDIPPQHITTPPRQKPKKVSVYLDASEITDRPTEEARGYALSKGWETSKIESEWPRFRDHGITKGRKHRGLNGLHAAWRNWVTSPYQINGASNGSGRPVQADKSTSAAAGRILERIRALNAPLPGEN